MRCDHKYTCQHESYEKLLVNVYFFSNLRIVGTNLHVDVVLCVCVREALWDLLVNDPYAQSTLVSNAKLTKDTNIICYHLIQNENSLSLDKMKPK